jgi:outer membrane protein assembly factor BamB
MSIVLLLSLLFLLSFPQSARAQSDGAFALKWVRSDWAYRMQIAQGLVVLEMDWFGPPPSQNITWYALNSDDGSLRWAMSLLNGTGLYMTATNGRLIYGTYVDDSQLSNRAFKAIAFDPVNQRVVWSVDEPRDSGAPVLLGNLIVTYRYDQGLAAYDAPTGAFKWILPKASSEISSPDYTSDQISYGDGLIFHTTPPGFVAYNASTGVVKWTKNSPGYCARYTSGVAFIDYPLANVTDSLLAVRAGDGSTIWNKTIPLFAGSQLLPYLIEQCPVAWNNRIFVYIDGGEIAGNLLVGQELGAVVALNATDGAELWRQSFMCPSTDPKCFDGRVPQMVPGDSTLFAFNPSNQTLYEFDANSGKVLWIYPFGDSNPPRVIHYVDGVLYVVSNDRITAFQKSGVAVPEIPTGDGTAVVIVSIVLAQAAVRESKRTPLRG